jgi:hypothetical protein
MYISPIKYLRFDVCIGIALPPVSKMVLENAIASKKHECFLLLMTGELDRCVCIIYSDREMYLYINWFMLEFFVCIEMAGRFEDVRTSRDTEYVIRKCTYVYIHMSMNICTRISIYVTVYKCKCIYRWRWVPQHLVHWWQLSGLRCGDRCMGRYSQRLAFICTCI